jgi:hypothetical protein
MFRTTLPSRSTSFSVILGLDPRMTEKEQERDGVIGSPGSWCAS